MLVIFALVYGYLVIDKRHRAYAMAAGAVASVVTGIVEPAEVLRFINWNVMGIFAGTLILADLFAQSKVPALCADFLVEKSGTVGRAILLLCAASGLISTIVENVAVVLLIAPIAIEISRRQGTSPVPFLIGIAISSNLQGTATLMGDPPSMIMAGYEKLDFNAFFFHQGRPSIFFAVELGAVDEVIPEPVGGAHRDPAAAAQNVKDALIRALDRLRAVPIGELLEARYLKYRRMNHFVEG